MQNFHQMSCKKTRQMLTVSLSSYKDNSLVAIEYITTNMQCCMFLIISTDTKEFWN